MGPFTCDLVISYYKEKLDWLKKFESFPFRHIYIYTKGKDPVMPFESDKVRIIKLDNIGRCDHTYVYHMHEQYDNLADVTIFTTGSAHLPHKNGNMRFIVPKVFETKNSVFRVMNEPEYKDKFKEFKMNAWRATNTNNQENASKNSLHPAIIRPFGKWYESLFSGIDVKHVAYGGVFAVSRAHIHHRDKAFYKKLLDQFPNHSNPEIGHYFERVWLSIFHPVPAECIFVEGENPPPEDPVYKVGGSRRRGRTSRKKTLRRRRNRSRI
jgi:hypothetical protein